MTAEGAWREPRNEGLDELGVPEPHGPWTETIRETILDNARRASRALTHGSRCGRSLPAEAQRQPLGTQSLDCLSAQTFHAMTEIVRILEGAAGGAFVDNRLGSGRANALDGAQCRLVGGIDVDTKINGVSE